MQIRKLRITVEREARGWTQTELSKRANVPGPTISSIESGRLLPYDSQRQRLAEALDLAPDRLLDPIIFEAVDEPAAPAAAGE